MSFEIDEREWLEADGLGGFASGTVCGVRTRRTHALLLIAADSPARRLALVGGFDAWLITPEGRHAISAQRYADGVIHPDGASRIRTFQSSPWPRWVYDIVGRQLEQELFVRRGSPLVALTWRLAQPEPGIRLELRPLLSGREHNALHQENAQFRFEAECAGERVIWRPYDPLPSILSVTNGRYRHDPTWYRRFGYTADRERRLDCVEDLASPGRYEWDLSSQDAVWILTTEDEAEIVPAASRAVERVADLRAVERRRRGDLPALQHDLPYSIHSSLKHSLKQSADAYLVRRDKGKTIVAGYPWLSDCGRDVFMALRGLCLATGRLDEARDILVDWSARLTQQMLPGRYSESGASAEFESADAPLWFVIAVYELLGASAEKPVEIPGRDREKLREAVDAILDTYARGTRPEIRLDDDGLLATGERGSAITWMNARIDEGAVTPRVGKPVELQALWLNALRLAGQSGQAQWREALARGLESFGRRFWNPATRHLNDVVDVDHVPGTEDASLRPNQILAVGGLPLALLDGSRARSIVDVLESRLLTPLGLRSLAPDHPRYAPRYVGHPAQRDAAYHQGTAWPWLLAPFVEAWLRVHEEMPNAHEQARRRFLDPLRRHLEEAGLGHVSEIVDAEPPHAPRGAPFHAVSLGETLRLERFVLAEP